MYERKKESHNNVNERNDTLQLQIRREVVEGKCLDLIPILVASGELLVSHPIPWQEEIIVVSQPPW